MKIEYDEMLGEWIVWEVKGSLYKELYHGAKKNCESFLRKAKKGKRKGNKKYENIEVFGKSNK